MPESTFSAWIAAGASIAAIVGAVLAASSARSARTQANAAKEALREARSQTSLSRAELLEIKRQSEIALHSHRLETYKAFLEFRFELKARAANFKREALWAFWAQARLSEFYFSTTIAMALNSTVDQAMELQKYADRIKDPQGAQDAEVQEWRQTSNRIFAALDYLLDTLDMDIKQALKVTAEASLLQGLPSRSTS